MSYQPPDLLVSGAAPTLGVGVSTLSLAIPAPGPGLRIRVWGWSAGPWTHNPAAGTVRFAIANPAGSSFDTIGWSTTQGNMGGQHLYPGGLRRPENEGVSIYGISSVGATFFLTVLYTVEAA